MLDSKIPTAIVVVAGCAVLGVCVWRGASKETIAAVGSVLIALAGTLKGFLEASQ